MRKLAILNFITLDGVMQGPGGPQEDTSDGFTRGGWAQPFWGEVMALVVAEAMAEPYDPLFGRKTYDMFAANFPTMDNSNPAAKRLNEGHKFVVTRLPSLNRPWQEASPITGDIAAEILRLKAQEGPLLQVHGSGELIQTLLANGLVDEYRLWTFPVVLGSGKRLFGSGGMPEELELVKSATTPGGVVMSKYRHPN